MSIFLLSYNLIIFQFSFSQEARDTNAQPPSVRAPPFIIARATGPSWTQVNFHVNATSPSSDKISVYCNPGSGSAFPMGTTIVLCAAKDPVTNLVGYAMFNVTVKDSSPPTFKVPHSILQQADSPQGAKVSYDANASDTVDGHTVITCNPPSGSIFPLGLNQVTCTAKDKSGNIAESSFRVIIGQSTNKISGTSSGVSALSHNVSNQLQSPALSVSDNATAKSQSPALSVSDNATAKSQSPALSVSDNATAKSQS
ncbi:MAG TPA: HYR domain-containing protein, partial [Nitrososphaeraceae archaeon]